MKHTTFVSWLIWVLVGGVILISLPSKARLPLIAVLFLAGTLYVVRNKGSLSDLFKTLGINYNG